MIWYFCKSLKIFSFQNFHFHFSEISQKLQITQLLLITFLFNVKDNDLISKIKIKISIYITFNLGET